MAIDFRKIVSSDEVEELLKSQLPIGVSTTADVQYFLKAQGLEGSLLSSEYVGKYKDLDSDLNPRTPADFDTCIGCAVRGLERPKPRWRHEGRWPWQWLISWLGYQAITWDYMFRFYFRDDTLIEIVVREVGTGF